MTLSGPPNGTLAMPGTDWTRLGADGIRQDLRAQLVTDDCELILLRYVLALEPFQ